MGHKQYHFGPDNVESIACAHNSESIACAHNSESIFFAHNASTDACAHASADESGRHQRACHAGSDVCSHVRNGNLRIFWLHILVGPRQSIGWTRIL